MFGWFSEAIARAFALEPRAELLVGDLDRDGAAQSRVDRAKDFAHAAFAELVFDAVWTQARARSQCDGRRVLEKVEGVLDGGPIEEFAPVALREQQLDFMAQFGICPRQQRRALVGGRFTRSMIELFNLPEPLRAHGVKL